MPRMQRAISFLPCAVLPKVCASPHQTKPTGPFWPQEHVLRQQDRTAVLVPGPQRQNAQKRACSHHRIYRDAPESQPVQAQAEAAAARQEAQASKADSLALVERLHYVQGYQRTGRLRGASHRHK